jgi:hypothetical protein
MASITGSSSLMTNNRLSSLKNKAIYSFVLGSSTSTIPFFISEYQNSVFPNVSYLNDPSNPAPISYKNDLKSVFQNVFYNMIQYLGQQSSSSLGSDFQVSVSSGKATTFANNFCTHIEDNIYMLISPALATLENKGDVDEFIKELYNSININKADKMSGLSQSFLNLFFLCFLPYFYFLYIFHMLPTLTLTSTNHGSRDGIVRRYSIMAFYKYFMYLFFATYKVCALIDPASENTATLRQMLDINITSLFDHDTNQVVSNKIIDDVTLQTKQNMQKMSTLQNSNSKIVSNRQNLNNILTLQKKASNDLSTAIIIKWVWASFLFAYLGVVVAIYFLRNSKLITENKLVLEIFFIVSLIIGFILVIFGMVAVVKSST